MKFDFMKWAATAAFVLGVGVVSYQWWPEAKFVGPAYPDSITISQEDVKILRGKLETWQDSFIENQKHSEELQRSSGQLLEIYKCKTCSINYNTWTLVRPPAPPVVKEVPKEAEAKK